MAVSGLAVLTTAIPPPPTAVTITAPRPVYRQLASCYRTPDPPRYLLTAYCPCQKCCGKQDGITSTGCRATPGRTIAVDPAGIPLGSHVYIEGLGERIAEDTGGALHGRHIDVFFATHREALAFGKRWGEVKVIPKK